MRRSRCARHNAASLDCTPRIVSAVGNAIAPSYQQRGNEHGACEQSRIGVSEIQVRTASDAEWHRKAVRRRIKSCLRAPLAEQCHRPWHVTAARLQRMKTNSRMINFRSVGFICGSNMGSPQSANPVRSVAHHILSRSSVRANGRGPRRFAELIRRSGS